MLYFPVIGVAYETIRKLEELEVKVAERNKLQELEDKISQLESFNLLLEAGQWKTNKHLKLINKC